MKELNDENIKILIDKIPNESSSIEKLILANESTVTTLLSVLFGVPIKVEVISQIEHENYIIRWTKLIADYSPDVKFTVCLAESIIDKDNHYDGFINGIREKRWGIGQLIASIGLATERTLLGFYSDQNTFSRTYSIESLGSAKPLKMTITEVFPKEAYEKLS